MWNKFIADTAITDHDVDDSTLVAQHVNLKIFEEMLKRYTRIEQVESEIPLVEVVFQEARNCGISIISG